MTTILSLDPRSISPARTGEAAPSSAPQPARAWQVGQVLQALVRGSPQPGQMRLEVAGEPLTARHQGPGLPPGTVLTLRVESLEAPIRLKVLDSTPSTAARQAEALRNALPRQSEMGPLLANLHALAQSKDARKLLPAAVRQAAAATLQVLASAESLRKPGALVRAVADAGLLLESRLARGPGAESLSRDLKAALLRLAQSLPQPPPGERLSPPAPRSPPPLPGSAPASQPPAMAAEAFRTPGPETLARLLAQVESALARVQVLQLGALAVDPDLPPPPFLLDLPLRHGENTDVVQLRIHRDGRSGGGQDAAWTVSMSVDLSGLGPLHARVSLGSGALRAVLWAEEDTALSLLERHQGELLQALQELGVEQVKVTCLAGRPPAQSAEGEPRTGLLETRV